MNAYELAEYLDKQYIHSQGVADAVSMLRQQANRIAELEKEADRLSNHANELRKIHANKIAKYEQALQAIANDYHELSDHKIEVQNRNHKKWARGVLE